MLLEELGRSAREHADQAGHQFPDLLRVWGRRDRRKIWLGGSLVTASVDVHGLNVAAFGSGLLRRDGGHASLRREVGGSGKVVGNLVRSQRGS